MPPAREFFYLKDHRKQDAALHEPILAEGDVEAAHAVSRKVAKRLGLTDAQIAVLMRPRPESVRKKEWDEAKHPRDPGGEHGGEFVSGSGGGGGGSGEGDSEFAARVSIPEVKVTTGSGANVAHIETGLRSVPASHMAKLMAHGLRVESVASIGKGVLGDYAPLDVHNPGDSLVIRIADIVHGRGISHYTGTTVHELGHAMEDMIDKKKYNEIQGVIGAEMKQISDTVKKIWIGKHLLRKDERFAEMYRLAFAPAPVDENQRGAFNLWHKTAMEKFPKSVAAMRALK